MMKRGDGTGRDGIAADGVRRLPFHYGWLIVATGNLCVLCCLGLGRFALGMLLPSMGASLHLSYDQMGYISTMNFVGYLAAVLLAGPAVARWGARRTVALSLFLVGASMVLVSRAGGFLEIMALYVLTGIGSGGVNVPLMGLVTHWFARDMRGRAAGFIVVGSGFGMILAGLVIPEINAAIGADGWRTSWLFLGGLSLAIALIAVLLLRDRPAEMGLAPVGRAVPAPSSAGAGGRAAAPRGLADARGVLAHLGAIYFLFGYTYVIYATFIVTTLVQERGFSEAAAGQFWAWVGFLSLFSGPVFGILSDRAGRKVALAVVFGMQMTAYALMAAELPGAFVYLSIVLYGLVAWSVPGIMAAAAGDHVGPERAAAAFGLITFLFGIGQIVGPGIAGILAERSGSFTGSYWMATGMAGIAVLLVVFLRRPHPA